MSYTKTTWSDGDIITANKMNNIETGVESLNTDVGQLQTDLNSLTETVENLPTGGGDVPADYQELVDDVSDIKADLCDITEKGGTVERKIYTPIEYSLKSQTNTVNGVVFTQNANNTVDVRGTANAAAQPELTNTSGTRVQFNLTAGKTYRLTGCPANGATQTYRLDIRSATTYSPIAIDVGEGKIFTVTDTGTYYPIIRIGTGTTVDLTFAPEVAEETIIEEEGLTAIDLVARNEKVNKQQATSDAGKALIIGIDGILRPSEITEGLTNEAKSALLITY